MSKSCSRARFPSEVSPPEPALNEATNGSLSQSHPGTARTDARRDRFVSIASCQKLEEIIIVIVQPYHPSPYNPTQLRFIPFYATGYNSTRPDSTETVGTTVFLFQSQLLFIGKSSGCGPRRAAAVPGAFFLVFGFVEMVCFFCLTSAARKRSSRCFARSSSVSAGSTRGGGTRSLSAPPRRSPFRGTTPTPAVAAVDVSLADPSRFPVP